MCPAKDRTVLGREATLQAIKRGSITVTPFDPERLGPASLDLTLAPTVRVFRKVHGGIKVRVHTDYRQLTETIVVPPGQQILFMPGETVLGITRERLRLMVNISPPFMGPGIDSLQELEMSNFGPAPLAVHPGTAVCQFVFQRLLGSESYAGRFAGQTEGSF
ncbi:dCTP deaminase [Cyanobium sp. Cruz-8D1]|nr:dCTP deaminase [Cyanobium sp. Cruz-8H5]MCP9868253.1 dCTP deaminase [Cyanobium sp. Cruz-8D1]